MMREIISKWPYHKSYFQVKFFFLTNLARTIAGLWWDTFFSRIVYGYLIFHWIFTDSILQVLALLGLLQPLS